MFTIAEQQECNDLSTGFGDDLEPRDAAPLRCLGYQRALGEALQQLKHGHREQQRVPGPHVVDVFVALFARLLQNKSCQARKINISN